MSQTIPIVSGHNSAGSGQPDLHKKMNRECSMMHPLRILPLLALVILTACGSVKDAIDEATNPNGQRISVDVSGLNGTLVLTLNGTDDLTITSSGSHTYNSRLASGSSVSLTVKSQPSAPAQTCVVSGPIVTIPGDVELIAFVVTCFNGTSFNVTSTTPAANASNVSRTVAPVIQFSAAVDAATVTSTNITLSSPAGSKNVTFAVSGSQVTVQPVGRLLPRTPYTLTITAGVRSQAGTALAGAVTRSFISGEGSFGTAVLIENIADENGLPQVAFDGAGNAFAVWEGRDSTRTNAWGNRYALGTGWGTAGLIENNANDAESPDLAVDANGNALSVWQQFDGTRYRVWANRYTPGSGWGTPASIQSGTGDVYGEQWVAMDANGNAIAVWQEADGTRSRIWANRYTVGTGWGIAVQIDTNDTHDAYSPRIAVHSNGDALVVWDQSNGALAQIWANRHVAGGGWGTAVQIDTNNIGDALNPTIAMDSSGNAAAVWTQSDGTRKNIWANRYTAGTGWGTAALIETNNTGHARDADVAFDGNGNAIAVWSQDDGTRFNIWANRHVAGTGWGTAVLIETNNAGGAEIPQVALDASGNAIAVWEQDDGTRYSIWANRYAPGTGWGTAALIEAGTGDAHNAEVAIDRNGNAMAVWEQSDGTRYNIWAQRFE
jgi:hypothetical protein